MVNIIIIFAFMSLIQATLTLPGIAGIVLTIGMAIDANVLIFERIREEIRLGKTAYAAVDQGFQQAFRTISDTNVTGLLSAFILYALGSGTIKGFAVTLTIGILAQCLQQSYLQGLLLCCGSRSSSQLEYQFNNG